MRSGPLQDGEPVLLIDRKDRRYLIVLRAGTVSDLRGGKLPHDDLIGTLEGRPVGTTRGETFLMVRATLAEFVLAMPRGAQIIYPKDLSTNSARVARTIRNVSPRVEIGRAHV